MINEKETRLKLIDPALKNAGWDVLNELHIIEKNKACIETPVVGLPKTSDNPTGNGFVDYVLFGGNGKPLAIIEAKKTIINEETGRVQACLYADALEKKYKVRPIIYYTNGYSIKMIDGIYPPRQIFTFHKRDELEYLIQKRNFKLKDKEIKTEICNRYYQIDAIKEVIKHFESKHSRSLIVLATGTGKTRVSCALSEIFIRNNFVKRILFLADRKNLVRQAKEETFEKFIPNIPKAIIYEGQKEGEDAKARIVFSTYQSMLSIIKDQRTCPYGIGHFDLIIVDEAHRSLFNKYAEIFTYFDALMIGLTATPRNDIHHSTYKVFNLDNDMPNYEYDLVKGVKDGYLTYYRALDRTPEILKHGVTYDQISDEEKEQYEEMFTEEDGTLPDKIEGEKFYSIITNIDTIRQVLRTLMDEGIKVNNGDTLGKTIIFARDHNHAIAIQEEFRKMFPDKCNPNSVNGVDYCVVIDNKIKYNEVLQREFKEKQSIRIVVSVDMMDTGVDIPEVVNLVFFKRVLSKIKFWQMIGRGTRLCPNINALSPSKAYFERLTNDKTTQLYKNKQGFLIFDVCNVFPFFKLNPDGKTTSANEILSLYQKIFVKKVELCLAMQQNFHSLVNNDKTYLNDLIAELTVEILNLNPNYVGVHSNLKYVHQYSKLSAWQKLDNNSVNAIKKHIAPNVQGEIDAEGSRAFDYVCYKYMANKFKPNKMFKEAAKSIYSIANYLLSTKNHISEVNEHKTTLEFLTSENFLSENSLSRIDEIREEIRDLTRYIDPQIFEPIISDFKDSIKSYDDAADTVVNFSISIDDFKTLEEKTISLINVRKGMELIKDISNLRKPSFEAIQEFRDLIIDKAANADEFNQSFVNNEAIVVFVRKNVGLNEKALLNFLNKQKTENLFNDDQIKYIKKLIIYTFQNGKFNQLDLIQNEELNFSNLFSSEEIKKVVNEIEKIM